MVSELTNIDSLAIAADDGAEMQVVHPVKGEIAGMSIFLLGKDSEKFVAANRKAIDRRLKRAVKKGRDKAIDATDIFEEGTDSLGVRHGLLEGLFKEWKRASMHYRDSQGTIF